MTWHFDTSTRDYLLTGAPYPVRLSKGLEGTRVILNLAGTRTALTADQRESVAQNYHAELDALATMADVDDTLVSLSDEPGPFLEEIRRAEFERRFGVRREGNVVHVRFGRSHGA